LTSRSIDNSNFGNCWLIAMIALSPMLLFKEYAFVAN
jgi:hypothetical protein